MTLLPEGALPQEGDVVLYHRRSFSVMTALIHLTTGSKYNHASIITKIGCGVPNCKLHEVYVTEATGEGVKLSQLRKTQDETTIIRPDYDDDEDRWDAVAWARAREGVRYGYFNAFMCGLNNVLAGLNLAIKKTDAIICSELVAEALEHAGFDFTKDSSQVSPGDLASYFGEPRR